MNSVILVSCFMFAQKCDVLLLFGLVYFSESLILIVLLFSLHFHFVALCKQFLLKKLVFFPHSIHFHYIVVFFLSHFVCSFFISFFTNLFFYRVVVAFHTRNLYKIHLAQQRTYGVHVLLCSPMNTEQWKFHLPVLVVVFVSFSIFIYFCWLCATK